MEEVESDEFVGEGRVRDEEEDGVERVVVVRGGGEEGGEQWKKEGLEMSEEKEKDRRE